MRRTPRSSMTSFAVAIEPAAAPRFAAAALAVHVAAAASPWIAHVPAPLAIPLSLLALAGFAWTLAALPGAHHRLGALELDGTGCRVRLRDSRAWVPAELGARSRAYPALVLVDVRVAGRRHAWLLGHGSVPADPLRRLKARVRLSC
jgi:hypothetical protein